MRKTYAVRIPVCMNLVKDIWVIKAAHLFVLGRLSSLVLARVGAAYTARPVAGVGPPAPGWRLQDSDRKF